MKFFIDHTALERLTDPKLEIRQNALKEITSIMKNNILVEEKSRNPHASDEFGVVNLEVLTRQLIRWFKFTPITNETEIFDLLIMIFSREDFLKHITKTISLERLRKEIIKISRLLIPNESSSKLHKIEELLSKFESGLLIDIANETGSFVEVRSSEPKIPKYLDNTLIDRMQKLMLSPIPSTGSKCDEIEEIDDINYEFWINLDGANLESFNYIDNELVNYKDQARFKNVLRFLKVAISDFPSEFFLQPPNVLETLIDIVPKVSKVDSIEILQLIHFTVNGIKERYNEAIKQNLQYIPIKRHMNKIIQMFINYLEQFHDSFSQTNIDSQQEILNSVYLILFDIVDCIHDVCDIYLNELLNMLAKVVRDFRQAHTESNGETCRLNYIVGIYLINSFVSRINIEDLTKYNENNLWEFESDLALLDCTLHKSHQQIYHLIKNNRAPALKDDKDMMLLLNVETTWKAVVDLFQNWETLTDDLIIYRGLKCLDTIRIHKSLELVELLFKTIEKCSERFNTMNRLRKSAEEIVLRLLSIDIPEIRQKAYSISRNYVQKKLTEDQDERNRNADLSVIIGIPVTTEIVTEILCFGYCDESEEIHKNAKLILFALLRAKIVFPNHWSKVLEAIRPVLPLVPCLFKTNQKLGFFSFDIFHQHSGFDENELNSAFVRFLFCSHSKAREMAKIRLLENLGVDEFTNDFIEIVPDNFCILQDALVTELQMPDRNIKFDKENYETVKSVLPAINHNETEVLQTILLQLSVQMNSLKMCRQSHDDNLWVYFMANLEMGNPNNSKIRKLTINILYKWAVTISSFRIYLSNEPSVLQFLIKTLIHYQDDQQIKVQASSLLFLLAFSDFIVTNEKTISLPKFLKYLECPFKFEQHWTESPFNKITQLEWLYEALEVQTENMDVQELTLRYLRFSFASSWFVKNPQQVNAPQFNSNFYYNGLSKNTLKVSDKLLLTEKDILIKRNTSLSQIVNNACLILENTATVTQLTQLIHKITCSLILPSVNIASFAEELAKRIKRLSRYDEKQTENRKYMLIKCLELYQKIIPWISKEQIIFILETDPLTKVLGKSQVPDENVYIEILKLIDCIIRVCQGDSQLINGIIKTFNATHKIHFPTALVEKLSEHLFEVTMNDKSWSDITKVPYVKTIFTLLRNIFKIMPVELDEKYVNEMFNKLIIATKEFLKSKKKTFSNTHMINQIFGVIEALSSLNYNFSLKSDHYSILFLWIKENEKVEKALVWSIIGNLTRKKDCFDKFCEDFKNELGFSHYDMIVERMFNENLQKSSFEQKALALNITNYLDHTINKNSLMVSIEKQQMKLISKFLDQKPICHDILSFMVKKMIQNRVPETTKVVKQNRIVEKVLYNAIENLDMVTLCYSFDDLKEHVNDIVVNIQDNKLIEIVSALRNASRLDANELNQCESIKKVNHNVMNILLILMTTIAGVQKIRKLFIIQDLKTSFSMSIYGGLQITNPISEIVFHIKFLNTMLTAFVMSKINIPVTFFGDYGPEIINPQKFSYYSREIGGEKIGKAEAYFEDNIQNLRFISDAYLLQCLKIFAYADSAKQNAEAKYEMKLSAFTFIRNLLSHSVRVQKFADQIKLEEWIVEKTQQFLNNPANFLNCPYTEATKKHGVQKCQYIIKNLCIFLKAITEWKLLIIKNPAKFKNLFDDFKKIHSWIENDSVLMNCFLQFIQHISPLSIIKSCILQEINGTQLLKGILKKVQAITVKIPHTESNLLLLQNGLFTIEKCCHMVDVRLILKNSKIFQILDLLHPQIQSNKKSTWNEVTVMWLEFFEVLSRYEDCECAPGQISLLCRIVRNGTRPMKSSALKVIRNLSMKSTLGYVVLISDDFMQTIDLILLEDGSKYEKLFILQTLLSIASKSEQSRSKLRNSSFNRKLKEHLAAMEMNLDQSNDTEAIQLYNLTTMLKDLLYV